MSTSTDMQDFEIAYVDDRVGRTGYLTAYVSGTTTVDELVAIAELLEKQSGVTAVTPALEGKTAVLRITPSYDFTDKMKAELLELLAPKFTRKVSAAAEIQRNDDGVHIGTRINLKVEAGTNLAGFNADRELDNKDGVLRVRVIGSNRATLVFLMEHPVADDDEGKITAIVEKMTGKIGAMLVKPVTVHEYDEYASLDPAKDFKPAA